MFLGGYLELVVEGIVPNLLHIVPICYITMFDRILECQDASLGLSLVADIRIFLAHSDHDTITTRHCQKEHS